MRLKWVTLLWALNLLCLPVAARANAARSSFVDVGADSALSASIAHRMVGNRADLGGAEADGLFTTAQSSGLLLLIGFALIAGASLIGGKIGRANSTEEVEDSGETTALSMPTGSFYEPHTQTRVRIQGTSKK